MLKEILVRSWARSGLDSGAAALHTPAGCTWGWGAGDQDGDEPVPTGCLHCSCEASLTAEENNRSALGLPPRRKDKSWPFSIWESDGHLQPGFTARSSSDAALHLVSHIYRVERGTENKSTWGEGSGLASDFQRNALCPKATQGYSCGTPDPKLQLQTCKLYRG